MITKKISITEEHIERGGESGYNCPTHQCLREQFDLDPFQIYVGSEETRILLPPNNYMRIEHSEILKIRIEEYDSGESFKPTETELTIPGELIPYLKKEEQ